MSERREATTYELESAAWDQGHFYGEIDGRFRGYVIGFFVSSLAWLFVAAIYHLTH